MREEGMTSAERQAQAGQLDLWGSTTIRNLEVQRAAGGGNTACGAEGNNAIKSPPSWPSPSPARRP